MLVVEIGSNLAVPGELTKIELVVGKDGTIRQKVPFSLLGDITLPVRAGVLAVEDQRGEEIEIAAVGYRGDDRVVTEEAVVAFIEGRSMLLKLFLARECRMNACTPQQTCTLGGGCRSRQRAPAELVPFDPASAPTRSDAGSPPRQPLDGNAYQDAAIADAQVPDGRTSADSGDRPASPDGPPDGRPGPDGSAQDTPVGPDGSANTFSATNPPPLPTMGYMHAMAGSGNGDRCWVKEGQVGCFNNTFDLPGNNYRQFAFFGGFADDWCAIRSDDSVVCGSFRNPQPAIGMRWNRTWFCLHEKNRHVTCVEHNPGPARTKQPFTPFAEPVRQVFLNHFPQTRDASGRFKYDAICVVTTDGKIKCDQPINDAAVTWTGVVDAAFRDEEMCALSEIGRITCAQNSGQTAQGRFAPDVAPGTYTRIGAGGGTVPMALSTEGDVVLFTQNALGTWQAKVALAGPMVYFVSPDGGNPPPGLPIVCGLTPDGQIRCNDPQFRYVK